MRPTTKSGLKLTLKPRLSAAMTLFLGALAMGAIGGIVDAGAAAAALGGEAQHSHQQMLDAGARAMGFDQTKTFHHFRLLPGGGVIEVHVNDPADVDGQRRIATHLGHISDRFAQGDFAAPFATHGAEPPGVATLKRLTGRVRYAFEPTPVGGRVRITTADAEALAALHAFLTWQIREHRTGDSPEIER
jgi:hypothetical protein